MVVRAFRKSQKNRVSKLFITLRLRIRLTIGCAIRMAHFECRFCETDDGK